MIFEDHPALLRRFRDFRRRDISDFTYLLTYLLTYKGLQYVRGILLCLPPAPVSHTADDFQRFFTAKLEAVRAATASGPTAVLYRRWHQSVHQAVALDDDDVEGSHSS